MRNITWCLPLLVGCSVVANSGDYSFEGVDASTDAGAECMVDMDCVAAPGVVMECRAGVCVNLSCAAGFGDCDGVAGNGCEADVRIDTANCGACGTVCAFTNAASVCAAGTCTIGDCLPGFDNCDGDTTNGCETDLHTAAACGGCGMTCTMALPICNTLSDPFQCVENCGGGGTLCGTACVDTETTVNHCGGCDMVCPAATNASPVCAAGACDFICQADFGDCDALGAEDDTDGCETNLRIDVDHCGACDTSCAGGHASWSCADSACTVTACDAGFADCDADPGCETDTATDSMNCGGCGVVCATGACVGGVCDPVVDGDAGWSNSCAVRASGRLVCWGDDLTGQLAQGSQGQPRPSPTLIEESGAPLRVRGVAVGQGHLCAADTMGRLWCWGRNLDNELGDGTNSSHSVPTRVLSAAPGFASADFVRVVTTRQTTCASTSSGALYCWGKNLAGAVLGTTGPQSQAIDTGLTDVTDVCVGTSHACALRAGSVQCWGGGGSGQLGNGASSDSPTPVGVTGITGSVVNIDCNSDHSCALTSVGELYCWGSNTSGQLGLGDTADRAQAERVTLPSVSAFALSGEGTCAVTDSGTYCWGKRSFGATAEGSFTSASRSPVRVDTIAGNEELSEASSLFGGLQHVCTVLSSGRLSCWGSNEYGQLGNNRRAVSELFGDVMDGRGNLMNVTSMAGGTSQGCAVTSAAGLGSVQCWGATSLSRLGRSVPPLVTGDAFASAVAGLADPTDVSVGNGFACAVAGGQASCWGVNSAGQLGSTGGTATTSRPVALPGTESRVAAGDRHACALQGAIGSASVFCWGDNGFGQLGRAGGGTSPAAVAGLTGAVNDLGVGEGHSCALDSLGAITCWGLNNAGQLGNGDNMNTSSPQRVSVDALTPLNADRLAVGGQHACAISGASGGGQVWCWGRGAEGQLGLGTTSNHNFAVAVPSLTDATAVAAGVRHTCALRAGGTVLCWGSARRGQLGNGPRLSRSVSSPVDVVGLSGVVAIAAGSRSHTTYALLSSGRLVSWGDNILGAAGQGPIHFATAQPVIGLN